MIPRRLLLTWVALPLAGNALLYLAYRDWSLWCFRWVEWGHATGPVRALRRAAAQAGDPGEFVRFSLASGLWILGVTSFLSLVWRHFPAVGSRRLVLWSAWILTLCLGSELAQAQHWIPGTADWSDVLAYSLGTSVGLLRFGWTSKQMRPEPRPVAPVWSEPRAHLASLLLVGGALLLATGAIFEGAF